jgi:hypothetical protein
MASRCSRNTASPDSPFPTETLIIFIRPVYKKWLTADSLFGHQHVRWQHRVGRFGCEKTPASVNDRQQGKPAIIFHLNVP